MPEHPTQNPNFLLTEFDGTLLLFHEKTRQTIDLNQTAALVWQLCDGNRSTDEIIDLITAAFPNALPFDIRMTLENLAVLGAVFFAARLAK